MRSWSAIKGFPLDETSAGKAGYCPATHSSTLPAAMLVRAAGSKHRPLSVKTYSRNGQDRDLAMARRDLDRLIDDWDGDSTVDLEVLPANVLARYWYRPRLVVDVIVAVLGWLAAIASAILAYAEFSSDQASGTSNYGVGLEVLAVVVFGLAAALATVKVLVETKRATN